MGVWGVKDEIGKGDKEINDENYFKCEVAAGILDRTHAEAIF
jgi:hypothetical protein